MGGTVIRKVKGKEYLYYSYYDNGKKRAVYCGLASDPKSKKNARVSEIEELEKQKESIVKKIQKLKNGK